MSEEIVVHVDLDAWTWQDHVDFEEYVGKAFEDAVQVVEARGPDGEVIRDKRNRPEKQIKFSVKTQIAMQWIERRRLDPSFTLADALAVPRSKVTLDFGDDDPKEPPAKPAARKRSPRSQPSAASTS